METTANILMFIIIMVPLFISSMFIPYLTRRTESFGVSIPEDVYNTSELKTMRKQYALITGFISILVMGFFLLFSAFLNNSNIAGIGFSIMIIFYIASTFVVYLTFHRKMKKLKADRKWSKQKPQHVMIDTDFRLKKLTYSNGWFSISFLITFLIIILTFSFYDKIPERIPMQFNFAGEVTNWADKSYRTVIALPIIQMYLTLLFLFINSMIAKAKQQLSVENSEKSIQQNILFRRRWSAFIIITGTAMTMMFSTIQLSYIYPVNHLILTTVALILTIGIIVGSIILSFKTGQGGSRIKTGIGKKGEVIDRDDDQYWKLGQFYFNKNDPALFLEKRFGVGWTINFGQPLAWIILLLIIALAIGIPALLGV